jgi:tRNA(Ile)-lysidine synthase
MRIEGTPSGNLQDWARRARYSKLALAAREAGFDTIVTAHHLEDQAETFLLRLARGSGVYGLAAMRQEELLDDMLLARPLLGVPRARLLAIAGESSLETVADPSNVDLRFDRIRVRKLMPALAEHGLSASRLAETAGWFGRAARALEHYTGEFLNAHFRADDLGVVSGPADAFAEVPEEIALRSLARIVRAVGGAEYTPPLEQLEPLPAALKGEFKRTLAGVVVEAVNGRFSARREWGRNGPPDTVSEAGTSLVWDGRFRVEVPKLPGELLVGGLRRSGSRFHGDAARRASVEVAPGLYRDGELIAIPAGIEASDESGPLSTLAVKCLVGQQLGLTNGGADEAL